jgi:hypothetical protein
MKVSLWQQFSSNHSASFMIVGTFESAEWANTVAEELRVMLQEISDWWAQYQTWEEEEQVIKQIALQGGLTPPEKKYQAQYGIEKWGKGSNGVLEWVQGENASKAIRRYENLVILDQSSINDTWAGPTPFDEILVKLGGNVVAHSEAFDSYLAMNLTCDAPDDVTAQQIEHDAKYTELSNGRTLLKLANLHPVQGKLTRDGQKMMLREYEFYPQYHNHVDHAVSKKSRKGQQPTERHFFEEELDRLLQYFRERGCSNIVYEFVQVPY